MVKKKLPTLKENLDYRTAREALHQAEADHGKAWREYREIDTQLGKMGDAPGPRRLDLEERKEAARRSIRDSVQASVPSTHCLFLLYK